MKKKYSFDFPLFIIILILLCIGINMVFSASMYEDFYTFNDRYYHLKKQLMWAGLGTIAMLLSANINYNIYKSKKLQISGLFLSIVLLVVVLFLPAVKEVHRWINVGINIQPSEIAKIMMIIYIAGNIVRKGDSIKKPSRYISIILISLVVALLVLKEPNMSTAMIILAITFCMLLVSGTKISYIVMTFLAGVAGGFVLMFTQSYRAGRATNFLNPWKDASGKGFQAIQSLLALGSGNLFGVGLGMSHQKFYYIPEAESDFIFAIIGEELGFIGVIFVIFLFILMTVRGLKIALECKDKFGTLLAVGITSYIAVQASINFLVVSSFMPVTGVPLPLISYGGSSLVITMFALGILLNISRYSPKNEVK